MLREDKIGLTLAYIGILVLTLIGVASAEIIYSGETVEIPLDFEIVNCSVINSNNNLEGLNLSWREKNIIIFTSPNYKSDNLTISCWVIKYGEIIEEHYSGGGSSCIYNKNFNWNCSDWSECINLKQNRTCKKYNNCYNTYGKPIEIQNCSVAQNISQENITEQNIQEIIHEENFWERYYIWIMFGVSMIVTMFIIMYFIIKNLEKEKNKGVERRKDEN